MTRASRDSSVCSQRNTKHDFAICRMNGAERDLARVRQIPKWGDANIPESRDRHVRDDRHGFADIVKVFVRTWPYIMPLVFGSWRDLAAHAAAADTGWSYRHAPVIASILAIAGWWGLVDVGKDWQTDVLLAVTFAMVGLCWLLLVVRGRAFAALAAALVIIGSAALLLAILVVTGWRDNVHVVLVSFGCLSMWLVQYRKQGDRLQFRVRFGTHLVYYYVLVWIGAMIGIVAGFFTIDLINQSVLQAQPLTPFLADFVGRPELAAGTVETLTAEQRRELQWLYIGFLVAVGVITFPLTVVQPYYYVWIMQQINENLRVALLERWHQLSLRYHGDHRVGDSVYRIYQDSAQVTAIIGMVFSIATQLTQYVVTILFVTALDPILGLLALSVALAAIAWAYWFSPRMRTRSLVARETNSDVTARVQEVLGAVRLIKASGRQADEQARFESDSVVAFNSAYQVRSLIAVITMVMFTIAAAALLAGEFLMALWANENRETFAAVLIGLIGLSFVRWNLSAFQWGQGQQFGAAGLTQGLLTQWTTAQDMAMGLERVFGVLDIEPDVVDDANAIDMPPFEEEIRFDDVSFAYVEGQPVLSGIDFGVRPGSVTAIVGPTGSGKSTLVAMLTRLFDPDAGRVTIDGTDIRKLTLESLRSNVSIALQENVLFAMSLRDNIRYAVPEASDEAVERAAHVACLDDFADDLPDGLDTMLGDRGGKLSTGQRQRLSIARAVVKDAPILVLDEPTAALDAMTEQRVLGRLAEWGAGRAIVLITHRVSTIRRAAQILYLDNGRVIEQGSHDELMTLMGGRYRRFVETEQALAQTAGEG